MNNTIKRILVPSDFSVYSDTAVHYAADLACQLGATLELIHVVENPFAAGAGSPDAFAAGVDGILEKVAADARDRLTATATALGARGLAANVVVRNGQPSADIVEHARQGRFDLIVMGTHGRTGLSHAVIGSVAERVQRRAPCAVLTVKTDRNAKPDEGVAHVTTAA